MFGAEMTCRSAVLRCSMGSRQMLMKFTAQVWETTAAIAAPVMQILK
jgi:hypothetical protein